MQKGRGGVEEWAVVRKKAAPTGSHCSLLWLEGSEVWKMKHERWYPNKSCVHPRKGFGHNPHNTGKFCRDVKWPDTRNS